MRIKTIVLFTILTAALCTTGCVDKGRSQMGPNEANLLGIAKVETEDYSPSGASTIAVSSDEVVSRKNFSGNKVTLLWGLITLKDY
ncbi:MAG: hypothetical protein AAF065_10660 [Verrucomicrobiota bacterium]